MSNTMQILSAIAFWFVLYFGYKVYFKLRDRFQADKSTSGLFKSLGCLMVLVMLVTAVTKLSWEIPTEQKTQAKFYGAPIVSEVQNLEGKVFKPQAFVVTEQRVLVYDKDGKVYALDGIHLDGLTSEQLVVASNVTYTVYQKGGYLLFGKL